ncbi:hypothetical protein [Virgibacillus ainsalahensis]
MNNFSGTIFSGDFDEDQETFYLTQVKNISTQSTLSTDQLTQLYQYLKKQEDTCTITVNDQMPILLQADEVAQLLKELDIVMEQVNA